MINMFLKNGLIFCVLFISISSIYAQMYGEEHTCSDNTFCYCGNMLNSSKQISIFDDLNNCQYKGLQIFNQNNIELNCLGNTITSQTFRDSGVVIENSNNILLKHCDISKFNHGVEIRNSSDVIIENVTATQNHGAGIALFNSTNITIKSSELSNNSWDGIFLHNSSSNTIRNNTIQYNQIDGIQIFYNSFENIISNNDLRYNYGHAIAPIVCNNTIDISNIGGDGRAILYREYEDSLIIDGSNQYSEIILCGIENFELTDIEIINSYKERGDGILLLHSTNGEIRNSLFKYVRTGVYVYNSSNLVIENSIFNESQYGVRFYGRSNNIILSNNDFYFNDYVLNIKNSTNINIQKALILNTNYDVILNSSRASIITKENILTLEGEVYLIEKNDSNFIEFLKNKWIIICLVVGIIAFSLVGLFLINCYIKSREV